jgi:hypothetical protein
MVQDMKLSTVRRISPSFDERHYLVLIFGTIAQGTRITLKTLKEDHLAIARLQLDNKTILRQDRFSSNLRDFISTLLPTLGLPLR